MTCLSVPTLLRKIEGQYKQNDRWNYIFAFQIVIIMRIT